MRKRPGICVSGLTLATLVSIAVAAPAATNVAAPGSTPDTTPKTAAPSAAPPAALPDIPAQPAANPAAPETTVAPVENAITVTVDGAPIDFAGAPPIQIGGRVMVPLRGVFEALGAKVTFDSEKGAISATKGDTDIELQLGSTNATINGVLHTLDIPPQLLSNRTFIPLRFVSEALGDDVHWNQNERSVTIKTMPGNATGPVAPPLAPKQPAEPVTPPVVSSPPVAVAPPVPAPPASPAVPAEPPYSAPSDDHVVTGTVIKVDPTPPQTLTMRVDGRPRSYTAIDNLLIYRRVAGVAATTATPVYGPPTALADIGSLVPNEEVRVQTNDHDEITRVTATVMLATAHLRYAQDNQLVLEDTRGTLLTIGPNLRYIDARGRSMPNAALQPGQALALFIAPTTRRIYQVSASSIDLAAANAAATGAAAPGDANPTYPPPEPVGPAAPSGNDKNPDTGKPADNGQDDQNPHRPNTAAAEAPTINLVQHSAIKPLRAGATLTVTVRGTPAARATFTVIQGAPEQPMVEDPNQPGLYKGTYTVRAGDNLLDGRVTAYLRNDAGLEDVQQSRAPLTIDTVPPRIVSVLPADGAVVMAAQPNIVVSCNDIGGSGIARATATINEVPVPNESITIGPNSVTIFPPQPLAGVVSIRVQVADIANNSAAQAWKFTVGNTANDNLITSVTHNAARAMAAGERVTVIATAGEGGRATFDVLGDNQRLVAQRLPMTETTPGHYRGFYTIQPNETDAQLFIRVHFTDVGGPDKNRNDTLDATTPITLADTADAQPVAITAPGDGDQVPNPFVVHGTSTPNATVEVSIRAEGVRYYIFEYKNEMGTQQLQANAQGQWVTQPVDTPKPNNVSNLRYVVTAVQVDAAGRRSDPVTVTVNSR